MKIRAQIGMVLNLDKCIGCHTCSVTCKNVWTSREGMEYAWFNNVETKPGIGFPKDWENQNKWNGGWHRKSNGKIQPKQGGRWRCSNSVPRISSQLGPHSIFSIRLPVISERGRAVGIVLLSPDFCK